MKQSPPNIFFSSVFYPEMKNKFPYYGWQVFHRMPLLELLIITYFLTGGGVDLLVLA
jgi:hypothetical protein